MRHLNSAALAAVPSPDPERETGSGQQALDASFEVFYSENHPRIERFLWGLCADRALVEDAAQEAFMVALRKWEIVAQHQVPLIWVRKVARHKLMQLMTRQSRHGECRLDDVPPARLTEPVDGYEAQQTVLYLLRQLRPRQAAVLALVADGSTDEEIAYELDLTINTVRTYKAAARQRFAELAAEADYEAGARRRT